LKLIEQLYKGNIAAIRETVGETFLWAVVKSNAYSHNSERRRFMAMATEMAGWLGAGTVGG